MDHFHLIALFAFLSTPALFAQVGTTPPTQVQVEEHMQGEETITVEPITEPPSAQGSNEVFTIVEVMPEFPGGQEALNAFLAKNLKYPEQAVEDGIEGMVFVTFVVEKDGKISGARVLRGIGGGCSEEALRVVRRMPNWNPGTQRGEAVRVQYNLPIRFKLASGSTK
ncbi:MAG: energy transducer TonB [Flavobacteriales bacterium]|nr:energy transducer TonB [Flavobacteriales bacterium]